MAVSAGAAPVVTTALSGPNDPSTATDEVTFAGDVSSSDLLHGIVGTGGSWNANGSSPAGLNDGLPGGDYDAVGLAALSGAAWAKDGDNVSFREFVLGAGANGRGFDITRIQSIAAWQGAGFSNQKYTVSVRYLGTANYIALTTVDYQPFSTALTEGGSTKVNVTDTTGVLVSGIDAIRFSVLDTVSNNAGGTVFREIDVFGAPNTGTDTTPPTLITLSPADGAANIPPATNLTATFSEAIVPGTGSITIKNLDTAAQTVIPVGDARVSFSGAVLTVNPSADLSPGTHFAVCIDPGAIEDLAGNPFAGVANDTAWDFTTSLPDSTAPTILSLSPADGASAVPPAANLTATFSESIAIGTGKITINNLDTASQTAISLPDPRVSVAGAVLTIDPATNLAQNTRYAVRIDPGAVTDLAGNPYAGIADDTFWNFTTATAPLRIMCLGDSITVGYTDNPSWANHPFEFGYRSGLYTLLTNAGYRFLFVGGSTEPWTGISGDPTYGGTYKPPLDLRDFGQDGHRGYGGTTASGLQGGIAGWLTSDDPDIVLLKIGTNSQNTGALDTLVNTIVTNQPEAFLIIAEIMPKYTYQQGIVDYNGYIRNTLVPKYQAQGKKVTLVNQYAPFLANPADLTTIDQSLFANGINHPDNDGYDKMARVWFEGIEALGLGPDNYAKWIAGYPGVGTRTGFADDPDGDGKNNGLECFFGTHPGTADAAGIVPGAVSGNTFTFTHPLNVSPATDLTASYRWSKDLAVFHADGATDGDGTTVTFSRGTRSSGLVTVTATVTGAPAAKLFAELEVTRH